jgi:signal peptidase I
MNTQIRSRNILKNVGLKLLSEGKTIRLKAHGYSMYPSIKPGSMILIEPLNIKGLPVQGEIIAIKRENGLVVHRLSSTTKINGTDLYIARGDSNAWADDPVRIDKIVGRVIKSEWAGEKNNLPDLRIRKRPHWFINRTSVIFIMIFNKIKRILR